MSRRLPSADANAEQQVPRLRRTREHTTAYHDAIHRLTCEDDDGNVRPTRATRAGPRAAPRPRPAASKGTSKGRQHVEAQPPTEASMTRLAKKREQQREERLIRNQQERDAHSMDVFFPSEPAPTSPSPLPIVPELPQPVSPIHTPVRTPAPPVARFVTTTQFPQRTTPPHNSHPPVSPQPLRRSPRRAQGAGSPFGRPNAAKKIRTCHAAVDVWHFFARSRAKEPTYCKFCK